jgi:mannose/cellobiose epimerase-like protein (N-acyl-D-glucosamine 2-epimerase family)
MEFVIRILSCLLVLPLISPVSAQPSVPVGARWLDHLNNDLLPFWTTETALGSPLGAFPSIRCDDRSLYNARKPCPEIGRDRFQQHQRYLVALSRQAYGYGVAFHLTGNRVYLNEMKAGVDFIRQNAMDRLNGGMATVQNLSKDTWGPSVELRTPQQLAYGLLGMSFYYYLTRDADVLQDVLAVKNYIFEKYATPSGAIRWQPTTAKETPREDKQLVAQLDQMNTYLVLLTPMLPEPVQKEWKENLVQLSKVMIDQFYSPDDQLFFKAANQPGDKMLATTPTDFGHNAKALWMIRWAGLITGHAELVSFAQDHAQALLKQAYLEDCGCWAGGVLPRGVLDLDKPWWVYAELDQLAGTLALSDPKFTQYLPRAYDYWFTHFVDKEFGEVWNTVDGRTHAPVRQSPKQWEWKNAYHSFEHALVGYIVGQKLNNQPITLYYAFPNDETVRSTQPYFYSGIAKDVEIEKANEGQRVQKVTFSNVH